MYSIVKDFFYNLSDLDFLSMIDGIDFYSKRINMKKQYWQTLFNILSQVIHLRNKTEKNLLASVMKELTFWRLGSVSATSYKKYFIRKYHSNHSIIQNNLKHLRDQLRAHIGAKGFTTRKSKKNNNNNSKKQGKKPVITDSQEESPSSRAAKKFVKDNLWLSTFLHNLESHFNKRGFISLSEAERSEFRPPTIDGSLGSIAFDNFSEEKFIHELAHLCHYNFNMHEYECPSLDEEHHDKLFWEIVRLITEASQSHNVENLIFDISSLRPWNVEDLPTSDLFPPSPPPVENQGYISDEEDPDTLDSSGAFDHGYGGDTTIELHQDMSDFRIYEMDADQRPTGFGFCNDNPFDDPVLD